MEAVIEVPTAGVAPPLSAVVSRTITDEAESYNSSVAGVDIEAVRAGQGVAPTQVLAAIGDRFTFTRSIVGFPMLSETTVPDDMLLVGYIKSATPGSRWCEIDLESGAVLLYGPEAFHTARNLSGLEFMFAITDRHQLEKHAEQIGCRIKAPERGCVQLLANTLKNVDVSRVFPRFADIADSGEYPSTVGCDDVLRAMTHAMSEEIVVRVVGATNRIDSRQVVHACIEYANSIGRIPSISELCIINHVSERRLRTAFTDEFDVPPSRFFRAWALEQAHRRLRHNDGRTLTVTEVATTLGFDHLGRFSARYNEMYREAPSVTLQH
jgi:AraC-like DNA-binding protein